MAALDESLGDNNYQNSIVQAQTIEQEETALVSDGPPGAEKQTPRKKKSIGHYSIGKDSLI